MSSDRVVITGLGTVLPGLRASDPFWATAPAGDGTRPDPASVLGRRGLRYKDRATQLAMCAAQLALVDAGVLDGSVPKPEGLTVPPASIGVVASSNAGNLDTVATASLTIDREGVAGTNPLDLPNASSNVIASSIAIRYGLRGLNLMFCNGHTSGTDAVHFARLVVARGRADRVVVVGVETDHEFLLRLLEGSPLLDGAAAMVVEREDVAVSRRATVLATIGDHRSAADFDAATADLLGAGGRTPLAAWFTPQQSLPERLPADLLDLRHLDLSARFGDCSGALGVIQCVEAARMVRGHRDMAVLATTGCPGGPWATLAITAPTLDQNVLRSTPEAIDHDAWECLR